MSSEKEKDHDAVAVPLELYHASPIHLQPTGEEMFEGGAVGGLHLGPMGDRLPGADPLYDGSLEARIQNLKPKST